MEEPLVSVIMPVYNAEKYLSEAIESVINQSFKEFEFIIIDDGSKDCSEKIVKRYLKKDDRIIFLRNVQNIGLPYSLNKGLKIAKGKYIARMDADDLSLPERLAIQVEYLERNKNIFLVGGSAIVINEFGKKLGVLRKFDNFKKIVKKLAETNSFIHPSIMFRNTRRFFYRKKFLASEEYDLYLRMVSNGKKLTNLPNFLIKYRISKNSFVSTKPNQEFFFEKAKEFYLERISGKKDSYSDMKRPNTLRYPNYLQQSLYSLILIKLQDNQMKEVRRIIKKYIKNYGLNKKLIILYLLSFIPYKITFFVRSKLLP